jgi:outer membrane lipoprotein-sorting protein
MKAVLSFLIMLSALAANADILQRTYESVLKRYEGIKTYEADLVQDNYWSEIEISRSSRGRIYYNADSLYIKYLPPDEQELYIYGNTVIMHDPGSGQAVYMDKNDFKVKPVDIIREYWQTSEKEITENEETLEILMKKDEQRILVSIKDDQIIRLEIRDEQGNAVSYRFEEEKINQRLPAGIFLPDLPLETSIIDNRTKGE